MRPENGEGREAARDATPKTHENEQADCAATPDADQGRKLFATLQSSLALRGYSLHELGCEGYVIARWNLCQAAPDLGAVGQFLRRVGGGL